MQIVPEILCEEDLIVGGKQFTTIRSRLCAQFKIFANLFSLKERGRIQLPTDEQSPPSARGDIVVDRLASLFARLRLQTGEFCCPPDVNPRDLLLEFENWDISLAESSTKPHQSNLALLANLTNSIAHLLAALETEARHLRGVPDETDTPKPPDCQGDYSNQNYLADFPELHTQLVPLVSIASNGHGGVLASPGARVHGAVISCMVPNALTTVVLNFRISTGRHYWAARWESAGAILWEGGEEAYVGVVSDPTRCVLSNDAGIGVDDSCEGYSMAGEIQNARKVVRISHETHRRVRVGSVVGVLLDQDQSRLAIYVDGVFDVEFEIERRCGYYPAFTMGHEGCCWTLLEDPEIPE
eukprot:c13819_g1_i1.p1 GENE.c13819_g1_i1~~c13819_g1_i1.p1  ORF type:complete len:355 (+),score=69.57 c13819_g1_i1:39-1103(+)